MASTFNLVRNSRLWFNQNVDTNGVNTALVTNSGALMTSELTVLDGFSFGQSTQQQTITLSEAGLTPVRGQRAFNTSLDPVEFSFSTYIKPQWVTPNIVAEESVLWNALFSANAQSATGQGTPITISGITRTATNVATATIACTAVSLSAVGVTAIGDIFQISDLAATVTAAQEWAGPVKLVGTPTPSYVAATSMVVEYLEVPLAAATMAGTAGVAKLSTCAWNSQISSYSTSAYAFTNAALSNKNQLQKFGMLMQIDGSFYAIDNCVLDSASIDFGLDGIAMVAWTGKGTALRNLTNVTVSSDVAAAFTGDISGTAKAKVVGSYITNKLSTLTLHNKIGGMDINQVPLAADIYKIALTGGNVTIANNVTYVVPANIGVVNKPIGYFTGTRSVTGNVTAYLRTGALNSGSLLTQVLAAGAETKYRIQIEMGGSTNPIRVEMDMNGCVVQVPTVEAADVMSTTINFSAQGHEPAYNTTAGQVYDIEQTNDLSIYYYSNTLAT